MITEIKAIIFFNMYCYYKVKTTKVSWKHEKFCFETLDEQKESYSPETGKNVSFSTCLPFSNGNQSPKFSL